MSAPSQQAGQWLAFLLDGEEYAVEILRVREIVEYQPITRVPGMPPSVRGVMNLRGSVIPVVGLGELLSLPGTEPTRRTCIAIVESGKPELPPLVGLVFDAVREVLDVIPEAIAPPPSFGTRVRIEYLRGMAARGPKFVLLMDLDRILTFELLGAAASADLDAAGNVVDLAAPTESAPPSSSPAEQGAEQRSNP